MPSLSVIVLVHVHVCMKASRKCCHQSYYYESRAGQNRVALHQVLHSKAEHGWDGGTECNDSIWKMDVWIVMQPTYPRYPVTAVRRIWSLILPHESTMTIALTVYFTLPKWFSLQLNSDVFDAFMSASAAPTATALSSSFALPQVLIRPWWNNLRVRIPSS